MEKVVLGIDMAKDKFDVYLQQVEQAWRGQFSNHQAGYARLVKWVKKRVGHEVAVHAGMESTGRYGEGLAKHLYTAEFEVSIINAARIKYYARSKLQRNKTDKLDAQLIADFVATQKPYLWQPPTVEAEALHHLIQRLDGLVATQTQEKNRLQAGELPPIVTVSIQAHLAFLGQEIEQLRQEVKTLIDNDPDLHQKRELLTSIPGIGEQTAAILLAFIPDPASGLSSKQVTAYAGLTPEQIQSGNAKRQHDTLSKLGHSRLRSALYMPAVASLRYNPIIVQFAQRLRQKGKRKMTIVAAAMRKLLVLAYGILKSGKLFDPDYSVNAQSTQLKPNIAN